MSPDLIEAVSGLWALGLVVFLSIFIVLFRKQIRNVLERFTLFQLERGETRLSVSQEPSNLDEESEQQAQAIEPPASDRTELEPSEETLVAEPTTSQEWLSEMARAFLDHDTKRLEEAYEQAQNTASDATEKLRIVAFYLRLRYQQGDTTAFDELQDLAEQVQDNPEVLPIIYNHIGWAYELGDDFLKANEVYETAVEAAQTEEGRADYTVSAARCLFAAGKRVEAFSRVTDEISKSSSRKALSMLYAGLAALYQSADDSELRAIALEKTIEYDPNNTRLRFDAAYSYSENEFDTLSLLHYKSLRQ